MNAPPATSTTPAGRRLGLVDVARWVVLTLVAVTLLAVLASLVLAPGYIPQHIDEVELTPGWTPELVQSALAELGWPASTVAWFEFARSLLLYAGTLLPGLLILRRKSRDWFGLYVAFAFVVVPALTAIKPVIGLLPGLTLISEAAGVLGWQFYFVMFYFFPDGRFVPSWTRWLLPVWVAFNVMPGGFLSGEPAADTPAFNPALVVIPFILVLIAIGSQIYRYFRRSSVVERQQTKWVVLALTVLMVGLGWLGPNSQQPEPGIQALGTTLVLELARLALLNLVFIVVPIIIAIAILRYRLWDIDVIIRRTLIYSALTLVLALAYFGTVLVLEGVLRAFTGQGRNSFVVVLSTLAIAALFVPVRARVQATIDRRFYRQKYDATRTLAGFAAGARDEVDLESLSAHLIKVVDETMQPESVGLWLKPAERRQP